MPNAGEAATARAEKQVQKRLITIYRNAQKEMKQQMDDFLKAFSVKDQEKRAQLKAGKITQEDYDSWKRMQVLQSDVWRQKVEQATKTLEDANRQALRVINNQKMDVFAENANYEAYRLCKDAKMGFNFSLYDKDTVGKLIREQPELMPRKVVNGKKDRAWNRGKIADAVSQSIIQGDSLPEMTERIARVTAHDNDSAMVRYAATAMTSAQNAGRMETMERAKGMGIKVKKKWIATLDARTRDAHAELDGQVVDIDEPFITHNRDGSLAEIMFPGDPTADGEQVWNCRCTLGYVYDEYPDEEDAERIAAEYYRDEDDNLRSQPTYVRGMTYKEWKQSADRKATAQEKFEPTTDFSGVKKETANVYKNAVQKMAQEYPLRNSELSISDFRTAWNLPADTYLWDFTDENTEWQGVGAIFYGGKTQYPGGKSYDKPHIIMYNAEEHTGTSLEEALKYMADLREREGWKSEADSFYNAAIGAEADYVHEYGHALANDVGLYFGGEHFDELEEIFQKHSAEEISRDVSKYAKTNCEELFAEAFVLYHEPRLRTPLVNELMELFFKYRR